jgi:hypothetical protein
LKTEAVVAASVSLIRGAASGVQQAAGAWTDPIVTWTS